jgi:hypothetical protein
MKRIDNHRSAFRPGSLPNPHTAATRDEPPPRSWEIGAPFYIPLRPDGEVASELLADSEETDNRAVAEGHHLRRVHMADRSAGPPVPAAPRDGHRLQINSKFGGAVDCTGCTRAHWCSPSGNVMTSPVIGFVYLTQIPSPPSTSLTSQPGSIGTHVPASGVSG